MVGYRFSFWRWLQKSGLSGVVTWDGNADDLLSGSLFEAKSTLNGLRGCRDHAARCAIAVMSGKGEAVALAVSPARRAERRN